MCSRLLHTLSEPPLTGLPPRDVLFGTEYFSHFVPQGTETVPTRGEEMKVSKNTKLKWETRNYGLGTWQELVVLPGERMQ